MTGCQQSPAAAAVAVALSLGLALTPAGGLAAPASGATPAQPVSTPSPEQPPYVTTGDKVVDETVLCIIEAMKVLNEIKAEVKGEIVDVLVENGEAVEYGQPLFLIRKSG